MLLLFIILCSALNSGPWLWGMQGSGKIHLWVVAGVLGPALVSLPHFHSPLRHGNTWNVSMPVKWELDLVSGFQPWLHLGCFKKNSCVCASHPKKSVLLVWVEHQTPHQPCIVFLFLSLEVYGWGWG
jgi:hypothetical protein